MNPADQQQLELLNQIQQNLLSTEHATALYIIMSLPIPVSWRLSFYYWLTSLPLPSISPAVAVFLIAVGPILFLASVYFLIKFLLILLRLLIPFIASKVTKNKPEKKFLQLTFPADTSKSAYATEQLYTLVHTLSRQLSVWDRITQSKNEYSLEIVSTKQEGIRYLLTADPKFIDIIRRNILSYLPGVKIKDVDDYLEPYLSRKETNQALGFIELKLSSHFALPLETQKTLSENDPISYLTGNMTRLLPGELISFQVVVSPVISSMHRSIVSEMNMLRHRMYKGQPLTPVVQKNGLQTLVSLPGVSLLWLLLRGAGKLVSFAWLFLISIPPAIMDTSGKSVPLLMTPAPVIPQDILNPYEKELSTIIKGKIDQQLFETSIRLLVVTKSAAEVKTRLDGLLASFGQMSSPYQTFIPKHHIFPLFDNRLQQFYDRTLSFNTPLNKNPIVSTSELSDLYHFPYTDTTKTEDMVKVHSKELPAPLSVKNNPDFDVVFGVNTYGNTKTDIGLTDDDRSRHVYILGQTGSGKSTIIYHMASDDIQKGRGVAVVDPHGDLAEDLLNAVPKRRINDCIYFNPYDVRYPIGINLLELTPGLDEDELEQEKELVCEGVISIFRRVFSKDENTDAHRIEYILRNAIYTAFTVKDATIFTVYELLNNPAFQKSVTKNLEDEHLKNFWKNEFGRAGNYQIVKMVSGVTAKVERFLFSPTARRILEQSKSTINFDDILATNKILICNLSEGKLGEDTSQLLGTTIIARIQQAALRRVRTTNVQRTPYYLFVDEFQNFATSYFTKLLSGGRKFGLRITIAEQSTSQQDDRNVVNVILANTGTVMCFRTASPVDEQLMLSQFKPYVTQSDIVNLPRYKFFIKLSAVEPEESFSGETLPVMVARNQERIDSVIAVSRKNFAIVYTKPEKKLTPSGSKKKTNKQRESESDDDVGSLS